MARTTEITLKLQIPGGVDEKQVVGIREALGRLATALNKRMTRKAAEVEGQDDVFNSAVSGVCEAIDCSTRGTWINPPARDIASESCAEAGWNWGVSSCSD